MWRYAQDMWDLVFPSALVYPIELVGQPTIVALDRDEDLTHYLQRQYALFTYRYDFAPLAAEGGLQVTTDKGWGCLVRATQMLLAHFLWRWCADAAPDLALFFDLPGEAHPFSLHNLVAAAGEPFTPHYWSPTQGVRAAAATLRGAVRTGALSTPVEVACFASGHIAHPRVMDCFARAPQRVLLLVSFRTSAADHLTEDKYVELVRLMARPQCVGVVGGVPWRSFFFIGYNDTHVFFLDPHSKNLPALVDKTPAARSTTMPTAADARCVPYGRLNTSMLAAFVLTDAAEWEALRPHLDVSFLCVVEEEEEEGNCGAGKAVHNFSDSSTTEDDS